MRTSAQLAAGAAGPPPKLTFSGVARLLHLASPYKLALFGAAVLSLFTSLVSLAIPLLARAGVDQITGVKDVGQLDRFAIGIGALILVSAVVAYAQFMLGAYTGNRIVMDAREKLFSHLQILPVAYFDQTRSGDLGSYLSNDVTLLQTTLADDVVRFVPNLLTLLGGVVIAVWMDWRLTLVVVGLLAAMMLMFVVLGRNLRKLIRQGLDSLSDAIGAMTEALANIRLVKAFAREPYENDRAAERLQSVFRLNMRSSMWEGVMGVVASAGFFLMLIGVMWYGGRGVLTGAMSLGALVGFLMIVFVITQPMAQLASFYTRLQRAVGAAERLFSILDTPPEEPDGAGAVDFPAGPGEVRIEDVHFEYVPETNVLCGLSLTLAAGRVTAVVGPSGSGKSTVASLIYRFYEPRSGRITVDGVPLRDIRRRSLREHVGIVPQDAVLFNGTIRENIRYGRLDASDAEIEIASRDANVDEFVNSFPSGYDTLVGERGVTLSGGQRQRVAIARALLKDPKILILDEATSALDNRSESLVREALDRLMKGRTTLVIAHRLSTIQSADQIAVLQQGRIVETGRHSELLQSGGAYAGLYELVST